MITPSGRFTPNTRLCLSMSDYHPETWSPAWRIDTILIGLLSFMLDPEDPSTVGGLHDSAEERRALALSSFEWHVKHDKVFCTLFPELIDSAKYHQGRGFFLRNPVPPLSSMRIGGRVRPARSLNHISIVLLGIVLYYFLVYRSS